ncbi:tetratricopeptide repeat protein [Terriglobus roseus]|uniref:Tetratricopeptide repeat-containing protein n=1 Tax=Terriglobus roseus TaxID=392734 RepID=A0A1H4N5H6_9BACT|nr:tetratricopeptide repeat protein [Terriglobus roseus]SEB90539.1 Tetratricopeptide repeat-containing protein [Terriglobus roseus]
MKANARVSATVALLLSLGMLTGCAKLKARDQLTKGVAAFKNAQYEQATNAFQKAIEYDPNYDTAKLYLATAYSYEVVPNLEDAGNLKLADKAIAGFKDYLVSHPGDKVSLQQLASIYRNVKKYAEAKEYEQQVIAVDPKDAEAHYTIGFVDWVEAYDNARKALALDGLTDNGEGNPKMSKATCAKLKEQNTPLVTDALSHLQQAIQINPNYDEAFQYLNLVWRRKADLDCGDPAAQKADLANADKATQDAMGARKINEQKKEEKATKGQVTAQ